MSENPHRLSPVGAPACGPTSRPGFPSEALARRTLRTAALASAGLAGVITVAVGLGAAALLLGPGQDTFGLVLAVSGAAALSAGVLGGLLLQRVVRSARATDPAPVEPRAPAQPHCGGR
jgi:hypothetical protein